MDDYERLNNKFERFAPYEDLKDLYQRCLPPIKSMQEKVDGFDIDNQKLKSIVAELDQQLSLKANKISVENNRLEAESLFALRSEQKKF